MENPTAIKNSLNGFIGEKHNAVMHSDSGKYFAVFDSKFSDDEIESRWFELGGDPDASHCYHSHDCCGCLFTYKLMIRRVGRRALATQLWGINI